MADFASSLPVRTESVGDIDVFISDAVTPSQKLAIDAAGKIGAVVEATDLDIRDLAFATDKVDVSGSSITATATDLDIRDLVFATDKVDVSGSSVTVTATNLDVRDLVFATDKVDVSGSSVTVSATDLDVRDLVAATDSVAAHLFDEAGVAYSSGNPLPVEFFETLTEAISYNTAANIATNATSTHTYAAPAGFKVYDIIAAASGKIKIELQINAVTVAVAFSSSANPYIHLHFQKGLNASSVNVAIIRTNLDNQAQDLYSSIVGAS